jgi:hypothetical protein
MLIEDVLEKYNLNLEDIGLDEKEFWGETLSYVITHVLEWFPSNGEELEFHITNDENQKLSTLSCKVLDISDAKIGKVDIRLKK